MSPRDPWLSFERHGGRAPRDDELLWLAEDGSFTARRTVAGPIVGSFEGRLTDDSLGGIRAAVHAIDAAQDLTIETPGHGATETLEVAGRTLECGSNETPPRPWRNVLERARSILMDDAVEQPDAAIRLVADASAARLEHAGEHPLEVDLGSLQVRVVLMDADGVPRGRWSAGNDAEAGRDGWVTAAAGWSIELPFDHGLRLPDGGWLQARVELHLRQAGERRAARLYVPVLVDA